MPLSKIDKDNMNFVFEELQKKIELFKENKQYYMKEATKDCLTKYLCRICDKYPNDTDLDPFIERYRKILDI